MSKRITIITLALLPFLLAAVPPAAAQAQERQVKRPKIKIEVGKKPPSYTAPEENWLNVKKPLSSKDLEGKVVLLEFSFRH